MPDQSWEWGEVDVFGVAEGGGGVFVDGARRLGWGFGGGLGCGAVAVDHDGEAGEAGEHGCGEADGGCGHRVVPFCFLVCCLARLAAVAALVRSWALMRWWVCLWLRWFSPMNWSRSVSANR